MKNGIINIYKERGFTSHDVVAKLRGILHQKKIGHTGTLDPEAEGVLPVCLGKGTRLCDMLTDRSKTYVTKLLLGRTTDTQDVTGTVLRETTVCCTEEQVRNVIEGFVGEYDQIPPMYSALKVNGKKLYELARAGIEIERKPRRISFYGIQILEVSLPVVTLEVECSKGTYIRTLCHDIGEKLTCGGCMQSLLRTRVGSFCIEDSMRLSEVEKAVQDHTIDEKITRVDDMFLQLPRTIVSETEAKRAYNGNMLACSDFTNQPEKGGQIRVYDEQGYFIGIYAWDDKVSSFKPEKMFLEREENGKG